MRVNATLSWKQFRTQYVDSFLYRKYLFRKFVDCSCRQVRRVPQPDDCFHYRYLAKTEKQLLAVAGRNMVDECLETLRRKSLRPSQLPPTPAGGYRSEPAALPSAAMAMAAKECTLGKSTVNCSFQTRWGATKPKGRLAILVTGIKDRYYPRSAFQRVVEPVTKAGYRVDYYALLDWTKTVMVNRLTFETVGLFNPVKNGTTQDEDKRSIPNPQMVNASMRQVLGLVSRYARKYGAGSLFLRFMQPGLREDPPRAGCNRYMGQGTAEELNYRRTRLGYKNVQLLWDAVQGQLLQEGQGGGYTHVLWQREDMHWVANLNLGHFTDPETVYAYVMASACEPPPLAYLAQEGKLGDKTVLVGGAAAPSLFKLYDIVTCAWA